MHNSTIPHPAEPLSKTKDFGTLENRILKSALRGLPLCCKKRRLGSATRSSLSPRTFGYGDLQGVADGVARSHARSEFGTEIPPAGARSLARSGPACGVEGRPAGTKRIRRNRMTRPGGFVRATLGRLRWAQQAQTQAAIRPRGRSARPTRRSAFVCKPGG